MKIEVIITCVGHSDFLAHTLPMNLPQFDRIIVVTAPEDKKTQQVCDYWGVRYHLTDAFRSRWGEFCKGRGVNEGLALLDKNAWICHMDADIALPPNSRKMLDQADLDTSMIYGIDRVMCPNWDSWQRFICSPTPNVGGGGFFVDTSHSGFPFGTRVAFNHEGGFIPIGFFQLWHSDSGVFTYPEGHTDAGREDAIFPCQWPRSKRGFIPEIIAYHLESEFAEMSTNWKRRTTKVFGPGVKI